MQPCERSDKIPEGKVHHVLILSGVYRGGHEILVRAKLVLKDGVQMQLTVRTVFDLSNIAYKPKVAFSIIPKSEDHFTGHRFEISSNGFLHVIENRLLRALRVFSGETGYWKCLKKKSYFNVENNRL